jgi:hypothetical protein
VARHQVLIDELSRASVVGVDTPNLGGRQVNFVNILACKEIGYSLLAGQVQLRSTATLFENTAYASPTISPGPRLTKQISAAVKIKPLKQRLQQSRRIYRCFIKRYRPTRVQ